MVLFVVMVVVLPLLLAEFGDWSPWLAERLVRWAARRLPDPASRGRYEEEWTANLSQVPGKLAPLFAAAGYLACLPAMRRSVRRLPAQAALPAPAELSAAQGRAVLYLAHSGIQQFLDIRAGAPAPVRTHELAWMTCPESRIFYAADQPAWLPSALPRPYLPGCAIDHVTADPRDPVRILTASTETLDFSRPVAVLLQGLLGHVGDEEETQAIIGCLMQAMSPGSYLVLTESTSLVQDGPNARGISAGTSATPPPTRIARIIDGLELIDPSYIDSFARRLPGARTLHASEQHVACVVARKP